MPFYITQNQLSVHKPVQHNNNNKTQSITTLVLCEWNPIGWPVMQKVFPCNGVIMERFNLVTIAVLHCAVPLCYATLCYVMLRYVMLCYAMLCYAIRADSRLAPSQWETPLQSNAVSQWLGANLESALAMLCYVAVYYAMLCYVMLRYITLRYVMTGESTGDRWIPLTESWLFIQKLVQNYNKEKLEASLYMFYVGGSVFMYWHHHEMIHFDHSCVVLCAVLCYAMLCYAMLCYAMLCYAMLCYAMLCYAMLCYAMLKGFIMVGGELRQQ